MNGKFVSVHTAIERAYRDLGMDEDFNVSDAIEWAGEALELIGRPMQLLDGEPALLKIVDYKAKLPCDLHHIVTCKGAINAECDEEEYDRGVKYTAMRYSTDAYHHAYCSKSKDHQCDSDLTYKVNNNFISTSFETGLVSMAYKRIPTDKDGYPLIPDDIKYGLAVSGHLKYKLGFIRWMNGKMPERVYKSLEADRDWYIGAAQNRGLNVTADMMESLKNSWVRLIPKINQHADGFAGVGSREQRIIHNSRRRDAGTGGAADSENTFFNYTDSNS